MSKRDACDVESRFDARRTLVIVPLLPMLKGVGSLGNEVLDFGGSVSAGREEGSIACDVVKI